MENYASFNARNIFESFLTNSVLFLCLDALDFTNDKGEPTPKFKIRCCAYDAKLPEGKRITDEVDIFLPIDDFLVLSHDVLTGVMSKKQREAHRNAEERTEPYFIRHGGSKQPHVVSNHFSIVDGKGEHASFAFIAAQGPGKVTANGAIIPISQSDSDGTVKSSSIFINMPDEKLKAFCLIGKAYAEQYIALDLSQRLQLVRKHRAAYIAARREE